MFLRRLAAVGAIVIASRAVAQPAQGQPQFSPERRSADSLLAAMKYPQAIAAFERLTVTEPNRPGHWIQLGFAAYGAAKYDQAAEAFVKASSIVRTGPPRYNAAAMYAKAGKADAAFAWLDSAIVLGFILPDQVAKDSDFVAIRSDARYTAAMDRAQKLLTPCMSDPNYHRLDFWVGDWDVKTPAGGLAGQSRVEQIAGGCALLENWMPGPGRPGGKSINTWNAQLKELQQYWIGGTGGVLEYRKGSWTDTSVVYLSEGVGAKGEPMVQRLTFAKQRDGRVRQWAEMSVNNAAFTTQYDFYYWKK